MKFLVLLTALVPSSAGSSGPAPPDVSQAVIDGVKPLEFEAAVAAARSALSSGQPLEDALAASDAALLGAGGHCVDARV